MAKATGPGKRVYEKTTVSLAPLSVDEALAALLKTPPPEPAKPAAKKKAAKKR